MTDERPRPSSRHEVRGVTIPPLAELCTPLGLTLDRLARRVDSLLAEDDSDAMHDELRRVRTLTTEALLALRRMTEAVDVGSLRGARIDQALRHVALEFRRATGVYLQVRITGRSEDVPAAAAETLARVAREALMGVERYARASVVLVSLVVDERHAFLEIKDDGVDLQQRRSLEWGPTADIGVSAMSRLVKSVGGRFTVYAGRPRGLCLQAVLPVAASSSTSGGPST